MLVRVASFSRFITVGAGNDAPEGVIAGGRTGSAVPG